ILSRYYVYYPVRGIELNDYVAVHMEISVTSGQIQRFAYSPIRRAAEDSSVDLRAKVPFVYHRWVAVVFSDQRRVEAEPLVGTHNASRANVGVVVIGGTNEDIVAFAMLEVEIESPHFDRLRLEPEYESVCLVSNLSGSTTGGGWPIVTDRLSSSMCLS